MNSVAWTAIIILTIAIFVRQVFQIKEEEGFVDYIVYGPGLGPWYGGRRFYRPWWGYRRRWWNELYQPAPWGPCPGPWCPYR